MRRDLLIAAERDFFARYPGGFSDPEIEEIKKKHRLEKMHELVVEIFAKDKFDDVDLVCDGILKVVTRSSLVSVFEKVKLRDYMRTIDFITKEKLASGLFEQLYGDFEKGFNMIVDVLLLDKLAKWPIVSVIPYYFSPKKEAFIKPTTVKGIIKVFELEGLVYNPRPTNDFYQAYKKQLIKMSKIVDSRLAPDNAAFSGFLMMTMDRLAD